MGSASTPSSPSVPPRTHSSTSPFGIAQSAGSVSLREVVGRDRKLVGRREVRDPQEAGEPADAGEVGLEHVDGARPQVGEELGVAVDALADRDR